MKFQETLRTPSSRSPSSSKSEGLMSGQVVVRSALGETSIRRKLLTDVVGAAAGALVTDGSRRGLAVSGVLDGDLVVAVLATAVDVARDGDDLVAVLVGLAAGTEADVKPSALDDGRMSACTTGMAKKEAGRTRPVRERFSTIPEGLEGAAMTATMRAKRKATTAKRDMVQERMCRAKMNDRWCTSETEGGPSA